MNFSHHVANRFLMTNNPVKGVQRDIAGEHGEQSPLRLVRVYGSCRAGHIGESNGMSADIGADIDDGIAWLDKLTQQLEFKVTPFAGVMVEATPDESVVA